MGNIKGQALIELTILLTLIISGILCLRPYIEGRNLKQLVTPNIGKTFQMEVQ